MKRLRLAVVPIALVTAVALLSVPALAYRDPGSRYCRRHPGASRCQVAAVAPTTTTTTTPTTALDPASGRPSLDEPGRKEIALELVASAENSTLTWWSTYSYIEDIGDGRGYTAGIVGFCSGTGDMLELVQYYTSQVPNNPLAKYLPALRNVNGTSSHAGLGTAFVNDWKDAAGRADFQAAQQHERDRVYFNPAVAQAKADGLGALGQFAHYDAAIMHGPDGMMSIRARARNGAAAPVDGGDETTYVSAFLDQRVIEMHKEAAHSDTSRVDDAQRVFLDAGNLDLTPPLHWKTYGDSYSILTIPPLHA